MILNDTGDVKPSSLSHLIGQCSVVAQVTVAVDAAFADVKKFDSALLVGQPGLGKSAMAHVIAQEMASGFHEILGQNITNIASLNALLLLAEDKDVIHIDECHQLDKKYQTALYIALDQHKVFLNTPGRPPRAISISDFTLLLSTTDEYALLQPLRDRLKLILRFEYYSADDLVLLLRRWCNALAWPVDDAVLPEIARRSRGTPRLALRLLQSCRRVCRSEYDSAITLACFTRTCSLEQIDSLGLDLTEQRYLAILGEGPCRLNVISLTLGVPERTVSNVIEPTLIRLGLVEKNDASQRQLTGVGWDRRRQQMA